MKIDIRKGYAAARKEAYGTVEEQLDMIYHQGLDAWMARQKAIKDRIPKDGGDGLPSA